MASLLHTRRLNILSNANVMYDFVLIVETDANDPIVSIAVETNGNDLDNYTLANWPVLAPKRIGNELIYKLDFWFSNESTPFHDSTSDIRYRFIRVTSTNDYPMKLTNSGKPYDSALDACIKYIVYTHAEIRISPRYLYPIELLYAIGTFTIYCKDGIDKILSVVTNNYTYDVPSDKKIKHLTLQVKSLVNIYTVKVIFVNARHAISISYYQYNIALNTNDALAMKYSKQLTAKNL